MWSQLDYIASISEEVGEKFVETFPTLKDKVIPISSIVTNYWYSKNLDLVDGQWKYKIEVRITGISHSGELITINSKIKKKSGNEMIYFTRCYYLGDDT